MNVAIIIPLYNEEKLIPEIVRRFGAIRQIPGNAAHYEFIFVDDGSVDQTLSCLQQAAQAQNLPGKIISFRRNFGHHNAIQAGLEHCQGDYIVLLDGDLQDPPELIPQLLAAHRDGFDLVYARRLSRKDRLHKKVLPNLFFMLFNVLSPVKLPHNTGIYRSMTREVKDLLLDCPENDKFLLGLMEYPGFKVGFVGYEREERTIGQSKYTLRKSLRLAWQGITAFTTSPLTMMKSVGFAIFAWTLLYVAYIIGKKYIYDFPVSGWATIVAMMAGLFGLNFFFLGIFGEYIAKIVKEVKKRPNYYIKQIIALKQPANDAN